ncbi:hypothetical protein SAMN05421736_11717 [Evansella caseinilytica]|uniref:SGNH/GDSL hydrolase family protein n=1 Tax=Evansella caseinilytica TaxID=1503961 RepID=A0A1H3TZK9_9BACI|nr:SGNH/GDSL hydrolase family protein [Evansella caseinilytica]SDZ55694.1 hypothetical protein SAMN05421736_11717 [Evansella caseinilytica]
MKRWVVLGMIILSAAAVFSGRFFYQSKLTEIAATAKQQNETMIEEQEQRRIQAIAEEKESEAAKINSLTDGLEPTIASLIQDRYFNDEEIHIVFMGSGALADSTNEGFTPWPELFKSKINEAFERDLFHVDVFAFSNKTSLNIIEENLHNNVAEEKSDIIVIEPFIWNDNGNVLIEHSLEALTMMISAIEREKEDILVILQPSQPVFESIYYPEEIEKLKHYAAENELLYIDHWKDWPDVNDEELLIYTDPSSDRGRMPTQEGHELWSDSVLKFFANVKANVSKEEEQ